MVNYNVQSRQKRLGGAKQRVSLGEIIECLGMSSAALDIPQVTLIFDYVFAKVTDIVI